MVGPPRSRHGLRRGSNGRVRNFESQAPRGIRCPHSGKHEGMVVLEVVCRLHKDRAFTPCSSASRF
jgi:hypothetical protein